MVSVIRILCYFVTSSKCNHGHCSVFKQINYSNVCIVFSLMSKKIWINASVKWINECVFHCMCTDESSLLLVENYHIPQTKASHELSPDPISKPDKPEMDMVREDPRDSIYRSEFQKVFITFSWARIWIAPKEYLFIPLFTFLLIWLFIYLQFFGRSIFQIHLWDCLCSHFLYLWLFSSFLNNVIHVLYILF